MLNIVWTMLILISSAYALATGKGSVLGDAFFAGAENAVSFVLKIGAFMIMWQGIMSVAEKSGLSKKAADLLSPVICRLFDGIKKGSRAALLVANNITANILGLSNAATPMGMEAMKELSKKSKDGIATNDMCLLAIINSASLQLVPSTLIAMRTTHLSSSPSEITVPIWIVSAMTISFAIAMAKLIQRR